MKPSRHSVAVPADFNDWRIYASSTGTGAPSARCKTTARPAPTAWAATKPGTLAGAMPAKLSLNMRPNAAAGLANDVEAVNQYAAPM